MVKGGLNGTLRVQGGVSACMAKGDLAGRWALRGAERGLGAPRLTYGYSLPVRLPHLLIVSILT